MNARLEEQESWLQGRLDWIEGRWGYSFASHVAFSYASWDMSLDRAEYWHGVGWGIITPYGSDETLAPLDRIEYVGLAPPNGARDLDEAAALEDLRGERIEREARTALAHGF